MATCSGVAESLCPSLIGLHKLEALLAVKTLHNIRIYVIRCPVRGWVFYTPPESFAVEDGHAPEGFVRRLVRRAYRLREEASHLLHQPPNRFWRGIRRVWLWLEQWTHPAEGLLRALVHADKVEIIHDGELEDDTVRTYWMNWLAARLAVHRRGIWINVAFLPLTLLLGLLPGPNIFIAWNVIRLYVHWQAYRGARRAHEFACIAVQRDTRLHLPRQGSSTAIREYIAELGQKLLLPELPDFYARWPAASSPSQ
jgi:hypothetical protein